MINSPHCGFIAGAALAALLAACGCAPSSRSGLERSGAATQTPLVWPAPPAPARITHVMNVTRPRDLGIKLSAWNRVANFFTGAGKGTDRLITPCGVAVDDAGNLCLTDTGAGAVYYFDFTASACERWTEAGRRRFITPVAVAKSGDTIFIADAGAPSLIGLDTKGKLRFRTEEGLQRPTGLALLQNQLFLADATAHAIVVLDLNGKVISRFGHRGAGPGELNFPTHIASDGRERIFVTDSMNARIQVFDAAGRHLSTISSRGDSSGHLSRPKGVAVDGFGHVYVADALFDNFQIFDQAGQFLLDVGGPGQDVGQLWLPAGLAINHKHQIFVADSYNHRVQVFQYVGQP